MNTTKSNVKTEFLLGAGLDVLHFESMEWLETIAFWKDEIKFFDILLRKQVAIDKKERKYADSLKNMDKMHSDLFEFLADDIMEHERLLARVEKGEKGLADGDYRDKHHRLKSRMDVFTTDFRAFKNMVFGYAKEL